jgi:hypothetical protein
VKSAQPVGKYHPTESAQNEHFAPLKRSFLARKKGAAFVLVF